MKKQASVWLIFVLICAKLTGFCYLLEAQAVETQKDSAPGRAENDANGAGEPGAADELAAVTPGYGVEEPRRDPFFPPGDYNSQEEERQKLTGEDVLRQGIAQLDVKGVIGKDAQRGSVIIGGKLYRVGDEVGVTINEGKYKILIKTIQLNPLGVVFAYQGETTLVLVGNQN